MILICLGFRASNFGYLDSVGNALRVAQHFLGGVFPTGAHYAAAGMRGGAAQIEIRDRCAMIGPAGDRAEREQLAERHGALEDVPAGQTVDAFQI